jgi:hypothetical protein
LGSAAAANLTVSATNDIYRAGGFNSGSDGSTPPSVSFAAGGGVLVINSATGLWTCTGAATFGADGGSCFTTGMGVTGVGNMSGIADTDINTFLVGIFLDDNNPPLGSAPPDLRFYRSNAGSGGIQDNFLSLAPQIGQVFFIGDGLTGQGTGAQQQFIIPTTATRLFLGFADTSFFCCGTPGAYGDNSGSLSVDLSITSAAPEPDSLWLAAIGAILVLASTYKSRRSSIVNR